jgi:hypothetical protein
MSFPPTFPQAQRKCKGRIVSDIGNRPTFGVLQLLSTKKSSVRQIPSFSAMADVFDRFALFDFNRNSLAVSVLTRLHATAHLANANSVAEQDDAGTFLGAPNSRHCARSCWIKETKLTKSAWHE